MLKVAILAEKFATDYSWYMDTILTLIRNAGDYVSEEVCKISEIFYEGQHFKLKAHLILRE